MTNLSINAFLPDSIFEILTIYIHKACTELSEPVNVMELSIKILSVSAAILNYNSYNSYKTNWPVYPTGRNKY